MSTALAGASSHDCLRKGMGRRLDQQVNFSLETIAPLRRHAAKRDLPVNELIRRLIERVAEDKLVDAVLDDREI